MRPVKIRGVSYPSVNIAARSTHVSESRIRGARKYGELDSVGLPDFVQWNDNTQQYVVRIMQVPILQHKGFDTLQEAKDYLKAL